VRNKLKQQKQQGADRAVSKMFGTGPRERIFQIITRKCLNVYLKANK